MIKTIYNKHKVLYSRRNDHLQNMHWLLMHKMQFLVYDCFKLQITPYPS